MGLVLSHKDASLTTLWEIFDKHWKGASTSLIELDDDDEVEPPMLAEDGYSCPPTDEDTGDQHADGPATASGSNTLPEARSTTPSNPSPSGKEVIPSGSSSSSGLPTKQEVLERIAFCRLVFVWVWGGLVVHVGYVSYCFLFSSILRGSCLRHATWRNWAAPEAEGIQ